MGANSGLKVWAEKIWDQRDSIMLLLFRVFSAGPRTKTLKSKKGSFPDTGCIHAAIPKFVWSKKELYVVSFSITIFSNIHFQPQFIAPIPAILQPKSFSIIYIPRFYINITKIRLFIQGSTIYSEPLICTSI